MFPGLTHIAFPALPKRDTGIFAFSTIAAVRRDVLCKGVWAFV